jgi:hypothetical protein
MFIVAPVSYFGKERLNSLLLMEDPEPDRVKQHLRIHIIITACVLPASLGAFAACGLPLFKGGDFLTIQGPRVQGW